jgi:uncharacterized membrane protein YkvA (DUF1232 family)
MRNILNLKERARRLKTDIPTVFIALKRKETPLSAKIAAAVTVTYALSPIDLIPDFIPVIGILDDIILLPAMIAIVVKLIPADILSQCRADAMNLWKDGSPKKWYCALPIVFIWILSIIFIVKIIRP